MASVIAGLGTLQVRVIDNDSLQRFNWPFHNYSTEYTEPFQRVDNGTSQGTVVRKTAVPRRKFTLSFTTLYDFDNATETQTACDPRLSFKALKAFYAAHGTYKSFIYPHPLYGDIVVRFNQPLTVPYKRQNGLGSVNDFTLELVEVITQDYVLRPDETVLTDFPFYFINHIVEVVYPQDSTVIPLGDNYEMVVKDRQRRLRRFTLRFPVMMYPVHTGLPDFRISKQINMLLLEIFYLRHRLTERFIYPYLDELIPVTFAEPLKIPAITGNQGQLMDVEIQLIETPYVSNTTCACD